MRDANSRKSQRGPKRLATALVFGLAATCATADVTTADIDADAITVLTNMSAYLTDMSEFTVDFDASTDLITQNGQKLKLARSGSIAVHRPDQFRVTIHGALANIEFILDGETLTLFGKNINRYVQLPATTIDGGVAGVRDQIGFDVPGADLLSNDPLDLKSTNVLSGVHVGMTTIRGQDVHHLAFRGDDVDWQVWVKDGEAPLPVQYVITSKLIAGGPEYSIHMSNWDTQPMFDETTFTFAPPSGAEELSSFEIDAAGNISETSE